MCVFEIERWSFRGWDLYGLPPIIITSLADSPETVNTKQRLCCVVLSVWAFLSTGKRCLVPSVSDPPGTQDLTLFTRRGNTPQRTSIYTYTDVQMPVHAHTHAHISQ